MQRRAVSSFGGGLPWPDARAKAHSVRGGGDEWFSKPATRAQLCAVIERAQHSA